MKRYPPHTRRPVVIGAVLLGICVLPYLGVPTPASLEPLYETPEYRLGSGLLLAVLVGLQWAHAVQRRRPAAETKRLLVRHLWLGALAPVLLLTHALSSGYGYQRALVWIFLLNCVLGLLSPAVVDSRRQPVQRLWLPLHIVASISVVALIVIHVVVVTRYH